MTARDLPAGRRQMTEEERGLAQIFRVYKVGASTMPSWHAGAMARLAEWEKHGITERQAWGLSETVRTATREVPAEIRDRIPPRCQP